MAKLVKQKTSVAAAPRQLLTTSKVGAPRHLLATSKVVVYRMLAYRDRSVHEIRVKLGLKNFPPEVIDATIDDFTEKGFLDDAKFARVFAESLARNRKVGPRYIARSLASKGIDPNLADESAENIFPDDETQEEAIFSLMEKKIGTYKKNLAPATVKKRVYNFLLGRGFSHAAVMRTIKRWKFSR